MPDDPTVFVVDDDQAAAESVAALMMSVGRRVEIYDSAETFLAAYDGSRKGCLVLDIRLPGMSGLELQQVLVEQGIDIPVIVMSGHTPEPNGVAAFLEKPYSGEKLCEAIQQALARL